MPPQHAGLVPPARLHHRLGRQGLPPSRRPRRRGLGRRRPARDAPLVGPPPPARRSVATPARGDARARQRRNPREGRRDGCLPVGRGPRHDLPRRPHHRRGHQPARALAKDRSQNEKPFFLAVGIIRPHLPFGAPAQLHGALPRTPSSRRSRTRRSRKARRPGTAPASS